MLHYASEELKNDKKIVLKALNGNPLAIRYASPSLQKDKEVLQAAQKKATPPK